MNKPIQLLKLIGAVCIICTGCYRYNFIPIADQVYKPKVPCRVRAIVKFEENAKDEYLLIGICEAKAPAGEFGNRNANNAISLIAKCACENGGDIIKILDHISKSGVTPGAYGFAGLSAHLNPDSPRRAYKDAIYAEIYIKK